MKATKENYDLFFQTFKFANLPKKPDTMTESRYIWEAINYTNILVKNRDLYNDLDDNNIQTVAKKALKDLGLM